MTYAERIRAALVRELGEPAVADAERRSAMPYKPGPLLGNKARVRYLERALMRIARATNIQEVRIVAAVALRGCDSTEKPKSAKAKP